MTLFPQSGKIKVTPEQSVKVQTKLFHEGYRWGSGLSNEVDEKASHLFWNDGRISECVTDTYFNSVFGLTEYTMGLFADRGDDEVWLELLNDLDSWARTMKSGKDTPIKIANIKSRYKITRI